MLIRSFLTVVLFCYSIVTGSYLMAKDTLQGWTPFLEMSAVVALPDGRLLIAEDERETLFGLISGASPCKESNTADCESYSRLKYSSSMPRPDDVEAMTVDDNNRVYVITSHARNTKGKRKKQREIMMSFELPVELHANQVINWQLFYGLRNKLVNHYPELKTSAKELNVKKNGGLNIEGLSFDTNKKQLLIAFRSPVLKKKALIAVLQNPAAVVEGRQLPVFSDQLIKLNLKGAGIRSLEYFPEINGYIIIAAAEKGKHESTKLWFWNGNDKPKRLKLPELKRYTNLEGVTLQSINGESYFVFVEDQHGDRRIKSDNLVRIELTRIETILRQ